MTPLHAIQYYTSQLSTIKRDIGRSIEREDIKRADASARHYDDVFSKFCDITPIDVDSWRAKYSALQSILIDDTDDPESMKVAFKIIQRDIEEYWANH